MEEKMEDAFAVDLDYEFDAPKWFDFNREETAGEENDAVVWFRTAETYPPSPLVAKTSSSNHILKENINVSPKLKSMQEPCQIYSHPDVEGGLQHAVTDECYEGFIDDHMACDTSEADQKSIYEEVKEPFPRCPTFMKPTASQLAKQIQPSNLQWKMFHKPSTQKKFRSQRDQSEIGVQAPKRQKLDGGSVQKLQRAFDSSQETNLVHKVPQKIKEVVPGCFAQYRSKVTIPREPKLETACRARRIRPKSHKDLTEDASSTAFVFKARPLNRKIFVAPSLPLHKRSTPQRPEFQEFHLKTSERALQRSNAGSSISVADHTQVPTLPSGVSKEKRLPFSASLHKAKVHSCDDISQSHGISSLNLKTFLVSSKQLGNPTKSFKSDPLPEHFGQLSLASHIKQNTSNSGGNGPVSNVPFEDSKENIVDLRQHNDKTNHASVDEKGRPILTSIHPMPGARIL